MFFCEAKCLSQIIVSSLLLQKLMLLMNPKEETEEEDVEDLSRMLTDVTDEEMAVR